MDKKIVIIPTYNEKENIENIIRAVMALDGEYAILVIEDGSPDGTASIVKRLQQEFQGRLFMIERRGKLGLGADLAIGSRYCDGISVINWPIGRIIMSYYASVYVRTVLGMKIYDTTAGFKCYKRKVLETIDLDNVQMKGYGFQIEMKYTAFKLGFKLQEVPIIFANRKEGTSKMSSSIFGEAFWGVLKMKMRKIK